MVASINSNVNSLAVQKNLVGIQERMRVALSKLSSGSRIPTAAADAAGLAIGQVMDALLAETGQCINNVSDGMSMVQTAEGGTREISNNLNRIRELSIQSRNGIYSAQDRASMQEEVNQLVGEIDRISQSTSFNRMTLLDGSLSADIAVSAEDSITVSAGDLQAEALGVNAIDITTYEGAAAAINAVDFAIDSVSSTAGRLGAMTNRLESSINSLRNNFETLSASKSRIMDADIAKETANLIQGQIQEQAGVAMLTQANMSPYRILQLLG
ncbi:MAG: flagellin [Planctomycetota bacterium]